MKKHGRMVSLALGAAAVLVACGNPPTEPLLAPTEALGAVSATPSAQLPERPRCAGAPASLWAGMPSDAIPEDAVVRERQHGDGYEIRGTPGRDVIVGSEGSDRLRGEGGNDLICAGEEDIVWGGPGNDHIVAAGNATLRGGEDNDRLVGGMGTQRMYGGPGNDVLEGGDGDDVLLGGADRDVLSGGAGGDFVGGCDGHDVALDFELAFDVTNGTVEVGIPEGATLGDPPHDEGGCEGGEDDDCGGGGHDGGDDGGCGGGDHEG